MSWFSVSYKLPRYMHFITPQYSVQCPQRYIQSISEVFFRARFPKGLSFSTRRLRLGEKIVVPGLLLGILGGAVDEEVLALVVLREGDDVTDGGDVA